MLPAQSVGILPSHEGGSGGGAGRLDVVRVQQDALAGQLLQGGAVDVGVVPGNVIPPWRVGDRKLCTSCISRTRNHEVEYN